MNVSIVIPVYNEAAYIGACLEAIAAQTVTPYEVIVVDNNSTDGTAAIAGSFSFVTLLSEKHQGTVYARDRGFDAASGDIIGRVDADTLVSIDWVAQLQSMFEDDESLGAVSGLMTYQDVALSQLVNRVDLFWRRRMARLLARDVALQGANMALRRTVWRQIRQDVCRAAGLHEDFDLAIHITAVGWRVEFDENLQAAICYRQADYDFRAFRHYALISPKTYELHGLKSARYMYQVVAFVVICYPLIQLLHRGYSAETGRFSFVAAWAPPAPARVNPATFVE